MYKLSDCELYRTTYAMHVTVMLAGQALAAFIVSA